MIKISSKPIAFLLASMSLATAADDSFEMAPLTIFQNYGSEVRCEFSTLDVPVSDSYSDKKRQVVAIIPPKVESSQSSNTDNYDTITEFQRLRLPVAHAKITVDGVVAFDDLINTSSLISILHSGKVDVTVDYNNFFKTRNFPQWLLDSLKLTRFDLDGYATELVDKWLGLSPEQQKEPFAHDIPSCIHAVSLEPKVEMKYPFCVANSDKYRLIEEYKTAHPEVKYTIEESEIQFVENHLIEIGLPLFRHH